MTVSLSDAGLLGRRRKGNSVYYSIADPVIYEICDLVCRTTSRHVRARYGRLLPTKKAS